MNVTWCVWGVVCWDGVCVFEGVGGWVSEFWTSGIIYMLNSLSMSTVCLTQFDQRVD